MRFRKQIGNVFYNVLIKGVFNIPFKKTVAPPPPPGYDYIIDRSGNYWIDRNNNNWLIKN